MDKFKYGERVAVYREGGRKVLTVCTSYPNVEYLEVWDGKNRYRVHYKQCRKLKARQRIWIRFPQGRSYFKETSLSQQTGNEWVEFVEVKKK